MKLSKSYAAINNRDYVIPDDIKDIAQYVLSHRVILNTESKIKGVTQYQVIEKIIQETEVVV